MKIAVFQPWGIGDLIMALPMVFALRKAEPRAYIVVFCGSEAAKQVISDTRMCDEVRVMPLNQLRSLRVVPAFYRLRRERFDAAVACTNLNTLLPVILRVLAGVKRVAADSSTRRWPFGIRYVRTDPQEHRVKRNLAILRMLMPIDPEPVMPKMRIGNHQQAEAVRVLTALGMRDKRLVGIHPGSDLRQTSKRIPIDLCMRVIDELLAKDDRTHVLIFLGPSELDLADKLGRWPERAAVVRALPIGVVAALLAECDSFIGGDSGLAHLASMVGTEVVLLAGPTDTRQTHPYGSPVTVVRTNERLACMPCYGTELFGNCPINEACMRTITVPQVVGQVRVSVGQPPKTSPAHRSLM